MTINAYSIARKLLDMPLLARAAERHKTAVDAAHALQELARENKALKREKWKLAGQVRRFQRNRPLQIAKALMKHWERVS